jgi:hypothetical protein
VQHYDWLRRAREEHVYRRSLRRKIREGEVRTYSGVVHCETPHQSLRKVSCRRQRPYWEPGNYLKPAFRVIGWRLEHVLRRDIFLFFLFLLFFRFYLLKVIRVRHPFVSVPRTEISPAPSPFSAVGRTGALATAAITKLQQYQRNHNTKPNFKKKKKKIRMI